MVNKVLAAFGKRGPARFLLTACLAVGMSASAVFAAPITASQATKGMSKWIVARPAAHMEAKLGAVSSVRTVSGDSGESLFHVVGLENGGFIVTSADDRIQPVIAFSDNGTLEEDEGNPLWKMLNIDLPQRLAAVESVQTKVRTATLAKAAGGTAPTLAQSVSKAESEWADLLSDDGAPAPSAKRLLTGVSKVSDVRVPVLLSTKWNQSTNRVGDKCYNYYTPNNYLCGCVATAAAQLMRKHAYPTAGVAAMTFGCWVGNTAVSKKMMGGTYSWSNMPSSPGSGMTEAQRQAIGKLCYDVGVASRMRWASGGSGASLMMTAISLTNVFGYANARCLQSKTSISADKMQATIFANLDGGYPVLLGIKNAGGTAAHAIVADGYGYDGDTVYTHLNLGWGGNSDAWYALPEIGLKDSYSIVNTVVYNVFPDKTGELLTGRVTDASGAAVSGATVTLTKGGETRQTTTNEKGIYAANVSAGTWSAVVSASGMETSSPRSVTVVRSESDTLVDVIAGSYTYIMNGTVGNSWGNDFVLSEDVSPATYLVTYKLGSYGTGSQQTDTKTHDEALTLKGAIYTRTGYLQTGWATSNGGPQAYALGATYTANAAVTLYPVWEVNVDLPYEFFGLSRIITKYLGTGGDVVIPATIEGLPVLIIGQKAFYGCSGLTSVTIPTNVTSIFTKAFEGCTALKTVYVYAGDENRVRDLLSKSGLDVSALTFTAVATVPAEISGGKEITVADTWVSDYLVKQFGADRAASFASKFGNDLSKALLMPTGKTAADRTPLSVWQDYVAGTDPTDPESRFTASITMEDGVMKVKWEPDLNEEGAKSTRLYTTYGVKELGGQWTNMDTVPEAEKSGYRFFKVTVDMP